MLKNIIGSGGWKLKWVLALGLLASWGAWGNPVESTYDACIPNTTASPPITCEGTWSIGFPEEITGGAWTKNLTFPSGFAVSQGNEFTLDEGLLLVTGTLSSWTENILPDPVNGVQWIWDSATFTINGDSLLDDLLDPDDLVGTIVGLGTSTLTFGFPLLDPAGTGEPLATDEYLISIHKVIKCSGEHCGPLTVVENAVPEPGTLLLLAGGLAGLAGLRRRRYS